MRRLLLKFDGCLAVLERTPRLCAHVGRLRYARAHAARRLGAKRVPQRAGMLPSVIGGPGGRLGSFDDVVGTRDKRRW